MRTKISIILLFISLALLIIYGADVMAPNASSDNAKSGFLHLNAAVRGGALGGGAVILSVIAFAISFRGKSALVSVLLFINGGLIIAGMIGMAAQDGARGGTTLYSTTGLGILLVALGVVKVIITRKK